MYNFINKAMALRETYVVPCAIESKNYFFTMYKEFYFLYL